MKPLVKLCEQNPVAGEIVILVANFEVRPDLENYRVTDTILNNLRRATAVYKDVKVKALDRTITEREGSERVREESKNHNAAIAIWGWYEKTQISVAICANFGVLGQFQDLPQLHHVDRGQIQTATLAELDSFNVQTRLAEKMTYLTLVTLGLYRYAVEDWNGTIARLTRALQSVKAVETDSDWAVLYCYRGIAYSKKKDYDKALADFNRATQLDSTYVSVYKNHFAAAYNNRGLAYYNKQDYNQALADYNRALQLNPRLAEAYNNRGLAYADKQDYDQALANYNRALQLNPQLAKAYNNRGLAYYNKQDYNKALADFNFATQLDSTYVSVYKNHFAEAYNNRGLAYYYKQDYNKALADYCRALKLNPQLAKAYNNRGNAYRNKQEYDKAIADYNRAIHLNPNDAIAYNNRGVAYSDKQDYDQALADFNRALQLDPNDAIAYTNRGIAYRLKGDKRNAVKDLKKALELTNDPEIKQWAEKHLRELGEQ